MNRTYTIPASTRHTASLIFLHGLGDTGAGWSSEFASIKPPNVNLICPTAKSMPVALNDNYVMPSWFNLYSLGVNARIDVEGIEAAKDLVHKLIDDEIKKGISSNRIMLGGFSQGGSLALYSGIKYSKPLAGVVALSCWVPLHDTLKFDTPNVDVPFLQCHGDSDMIVSLEKGKLTKEFLSKNLKNYTFKEYENLEHSTSNKEMAEVRAFMNKYLKD